MSEDLAEHDKIMHSMLTSENGMVLMALPRNAAERC